MNFWQNLWTQWMRRPQNVWLRKASFQIHLWTGIAMGLYILVISVSGSAIVFRNEIYRVADQGPRIVKVTGEMLTDDQLKDAARKRYPGQAVSYVWKGKQPNHATEVWLDDDGVKNQRLFDPYTGEDLGPSVPWAIQAASFFEKLHTDLLAGETGRWWNGVAAVFCSLLCISGAIVWWPGVERWKRALWVNPKSGWKRINWDLHSAFGFWTFGLVFLWMISGIYLVWPLPFQKFVNHYSPLIQYAIPEEPAALNVAPGGIFAQLPPEPPAVNGRIGGEVDTPVPEQPTKGKFGQGKGRRQPPRRSNGDIFLRWIYYLHFGNFAGNKVKALWVVLGLVPVLLFVTGTIMWWNRVLSPASRRMKRAGQVPTAL